MVVATAGAFCVLRKDDLLRLIFDTRRCNAWFAEPPHVELASGESLADLMTEAGHDLFGAQGYVEVCFYQYRLPSWLRRYFALPPIQAKFLPWGLR